MRLVICGGNRHAVLASLIVLVLILTVCTTTSFALDIRLHKRTIKLKDAASTQINTESEQMNSSRRRRRLYQEQHNTNDNKELYLLVISPTEYSPDTIGQLTQSLGCKPEHVDKFVYMCYTTEQKVTDLHVATDETLIRWTQILDTKDKLSKDLDELVFLSKYPVQPLHVVISSDVVPEGEDADAFINKLVQNLEQEIGEKLKLTVSVTPLSQKKLSVQLVFKRSAT
jgi:hypothetical protein